MTVAVTPDGRADALVSRGGAPVFALPAERQVTMSEFLELSKQGQSDQVYYLQHQNSSLTEEAGPLLKDVGRRIAWAQEAFGALEQRLLCA